MESSNNAGADGSNAPGGDQSQGGGGAKDTDSEQVVAKEMSKSPSGMSLSSLQAQAENPTPQRIHPPPDAVAGARGDKLCLVMKGLPARGKTFIARRIRQYLRFFHGAKCELFNVGVYRREMFGPYHRADFFDPHNAKYAEMRRQCSRAAMDDMKRWIEDHAGIGTVAIFDATNSTLADQVRAYELVVLISILKHDYRLRVAVRIGLLQSWKPSWSQNHI
mgnify:CR=1 FL=1